MVTGRTSPPGERSDWAASNACSSLPRLGAALRPSLPGVDGADEGLELGLECAPSSSNSSRGGREMRPGLGVVRGSWTFDMSRVSLQTSTVEEGEVRIALLSVWATTDFPGPSSVLAALKAAYFPICVCSDDACYSGSLAPRTRQPLSRDMRATG